MVYISFRGISNKFARQGAKRGLTPEKRKSITVYLFSPVNASPASCGQSKKA
ncbi:MAG: hypothetical protein ACLVMH_03680 [Christensenellales bacterium]